ncbi:MAG: acyl-CoA/acyl-ACP dehydrogenase [Betaproteobacteria bacterium]|nr:acyl-CoA/acyl-ACP dehydrogenase [Betaproteobacteria bacterium]
MDFRLTAEQEMMRDAARRLAERDIRPVLERHDRDRPLPKDVFLDLFARVARLGLLAPRLPEAAGGSGIGMLDYGIMFEQIPPAISMSLLSQDGCIARIYAEGTPEQRERLLPDLVAGRKIGCTGSTEPDAGSDPRAIRTRVRREGDTLVLNGTKMWITNVSLCDIMIVTCVDAVRGNSRDCIVKVVVERDQSPFESRQIDAIGLRQGLLGEAVFENCRVPVRNLIDSPEGGTKVLKTTWLVNRALVGLQAVHLAQKALDAALEYAGVRKQFGKVIAAHQLVQKNLSDIATAVEASRLLCYRALSIIDQGRPAEGATAMAKRFAQMACQEALWQAMNVFGAMGLAREARIEELYRDVRMLAIPDGTNEILALIHGRELTGIEAFRGVAQTA